MGTLLCFYAVATIDRVKKVKSIIRDFNQALHIRLQQPNYLPYWESHILIFNDLWCHQNMVESILNLNAIKQASTPISNNEKENNQA